MKTMFFDYRFCDLLHMSANYSILSNIRSAQEDRGKYDLCLGYEMPAYEICRHGFGWFRWHEMSTGLMVVFYGKELLLAQESLKTKLSYK